MYRTVVIQYTPKAKQMARRIEKAAKRMEQEGFLVDRKALTEFGQMLEGRIAADQAAIYELAGETFNINSTQQFGKILF